MRTLILFSAFALATAAQAQEAATPPGGGLSQACRTEIQNLCPMTGDRAARRACMMEKRASISAPCKSELMARMAARRAEHPEHSMGDQPPMPSDQAPMSSHPAPAPQPQ